MVHFGESEWCISVRAHGAFHDFISSVQNQKQYFLITYGASGPVLDVVKFNEYPDAKLAVDEWYTVKERVNKYTLVRLVIRARKTTVEKFMSYASIKYGIVFQGVFGYTKIATNNASNDLYSHVGFKMMIDYKISGNSDFDSWILNPSRHRGGIVEDFMRKNPQIVRAILSDIDSRRGPGQESKKRARDETTDTFVGDEIGSSHEQTISSAQITANKLIQDLTMDLEESNVEIETLNIQIEKSDIEFKKELDLSTVELKKREEQLTEANTTIIERESRINTLDATIADQGRRITILESDSAELGRTVNARDEHITGLEARLNTSTANIAGLNARLTTSTNTITGLEAQLTQSTATITERDAQLAEYKKEIEQLKTECDHRKRRNDDLGPKYERLTFLCQDKDAKVIALFSLRISWILTPFFHPDR